MTKELLAIRAFCRQNCGVEKNFDVAGLVKKCRTKDCNLLPYKNGIDPKVNTHDRPLKRKDGYR